MSPRPRTTSDAYLLTATLNTVSRLGPTRMTLADVAREAGVSPATLVQRFGSKRGLLLALASSSNDGVSEQFAQLRAAHDSPLAALAAVADCMAQMTVSPEILSNSLAFLQIDLVDPDFHKHALAHSRAMRTEIKALLEEAIEVGELARCDTNRLARGVQVVLGGALLQ
jgi:AcrR family transcriptional regulator